MEPSSAPVDDPVVAGLDIHVQAIDHTDAFDQAMGVAAVLFSHQLDLVGVVLVQNVVIENQTGIVVKLDGLPRQIPGFCVSPNCSRAWE
jgi:hypothetical protein